MEFGLVLSGGGVRGVAHLGILKAFEEWGIRPTIISGSSAGAIIGSLYSYGYKADEVYEIVHKAKLINILRPALTIKGLLSMERAYDFFYQILPENTFDSLKIPLFVCATNVRTGDPVYFNSGNLIRSVLASSAIPVLFTPVQIQNEHYIDGGVANNLPVDPLINAGRKIVGIHCNPIDRDFNLKNMKNLLERTFILIVNANVERKKKHCHLYLEPYLLKNFTALDFSQVDEIYKLGYQFALDNERLIKAELAH